MSAEVTVVFYGIRISIDAADEDALDLLGAKRHPLMLEARRLGLDSYWANFDSPKERYYLFVGRKLSLLGAENSKESVLSVDELRKLDESTKSAFQQLSKYGSPNFYVQWMADV